MGYNVPRGGGPPAAHAPTHESGGGDEIDVTGLLGVLADEQNPTDHAADHLPGGSDLLTTATGTDTGTTNAEGAAASLSRSDHTHRVVGLVESGGDGLSIGSLTAGETLIRSGASIVSVAQVAPSAHAPSHVPGGSDPLATASAGDVGSSNSEGSAATFARADHGHRVVAVVESGGQALDIDAIANADLLVRSGTDIVGLSPGSAGSLLVSDGSAWSAVAAPATAGEILVSTASGAQWVKPAFSEVRGSTNNPTKNGAAFAVIPEMTTSVTPTGGRLFVFMKVNMDMQDEDDGTIRITAGGAVEDESDAGYEATDGLLGLIPGELAGTDFVCMGVVEGLTAGVPVTVQGEWSETSGTMRAREDNRVLIVWEAY